MSLYYHSHTVHGEIHFDKAESEWLYFRKEVVYKDRKTMIIEVFSKESITAVGQVRWYAPWRKYTFWPAANTVFEATCLSAIAHFCERLMRDHKKNQLWRKQNSTQLVTN